MRYGHQFRTSPLGGIFDRKRFGKLEIKLKFDIMRNCELQWGTMLSLYLLCNSQVSNCILGEEVVAAFCLTQIG